MRTFTNYAGVETIVNAMHNIFSKENTEAVALINAENAFSTYRSNCCVVPARLSFFGGGEKLYKEGTTEGDPTSMVAYARDILPMLHSLLDFILTDELNRCKKYLG